VIVGGAWLEGLGIQDEGMEERRPRKEDGLRVSVER
jgi:hypothetical protein